MDSALLGSFPAEMIDFALLLSSEQVGRVMQCIQDACKGELLPGFVGALPSSAPTDYVQAHFAEHRKKLYTQTPTSAPTTPESRGSTSASPWIWETPVRRKRPKKDKAKAEEQWFSAGTRLSEEVTNIEGAQSASMLLNHYVTLSREVNTIDAKAKNFTGQMCGVHPM